MIVLAKPITNGSFEIRVFKDGSNSDTDPIDSVLNLINKGDGVAEVSMAHGTLSNDVNVLLGLKAIELGFSKLQFHATRGTTVTRWAEHVKSDELFDYYSVDLQAALERLNKGQS